MSDDLEGIFGSPIYGYSRRQAIEDGVLVDLMQGETGALVREAGFLFPVAMTTAAFEATVCPIDGELPEGQDIKGRLWDVLSLLRFAIRRSHGGSIVHYQVSVYQGNGQRRTVALKSVCGPGDDAAPVITIMLPEED